MASYVLEDIWQDKKHENSHDQTGENKRPRLFERENKSELLSNTNIVYRQTS